MQIKRLVLRCLLKGVLTLHPLDPVSAAASDRGRLIYGAGIGVLCFAIRQWGAYPDGIAFAVLLMNMAVPLIDRYTVPRVYGYDRHP